MLRFVHALVFALVAVFGIASGAHALGSKTALRRNFEAVQDHVGAFGSQGVGRRQQNPSHGTVIASECCHAARGTPALRQQYVNAIEQLADAAPSMQASGAAPEAVARILHAERRAIGEQFKALTPKDMLDKIYARNVAKYGDKLGPTVDWLRAQGKSWQDIIDSAVRTGGKDLGL
jgi:hypothetical protein